MKTFNRQYQAIIITIVIFFCIQNANAQQLRKLKINSDPCTCSAIKNSQQDDWKLSAVGDSVVICNSVKSITNVGDRVYTSYVDFLKKHWLGADYQKVFFCKTGQSVPYVQRINGYSVSYRKREFLIHWSIRIDSFEVSKKAWSEKIRGLFLQRVYAKNGNLYLSDKKVMFHPHKISKYATEDVDKMYQEQKKKRNDYTVSFILSKRLFVLAMSGHQLSQTRLFNLNKEFKLKDDSSILNYQSVLKQKLGDPIKIQHDG
jgi:hypothetical protein